MHNKVLNQVRGILEGLYDSSAEYIDVLYYRYAIWINGKKIIRAERGIRVSMRSFYFYVDYKRPDLVRVLYFTRSSSTLRRSSEEIKELGKPYNMDYYKEESGLYNGNLKITQLAPIITFANELCSDV